jgi:hypothetical protein
MNKTVHQKLTDKYQYTHAAQVGFSCPDDVIAAFRQERKMLKQAAQDLLSPRPEAISRILEMSRAM